MCHLSDAALPRMQHCCQRPCCVECTRKFAFDRPGWLGKSFGCRWDFVCFGVSNGFHMRRPNEKVADALFPKFNSVVSYHKDFLTPPCPERVPRLAAPPSLLAVSCPTSTLSSSRRPARRKSKFLQYRQLGDFNQAFFNRLHQTAERVYHITLALAEVE